MKTQIPRGVQLIALLKLIKALILLGLATGALRFLGNNLEDGLAQLMNQFHVDPDNRYFQSFVTKATGLSPRLPLIVAGSFFYGAIFLVEGVGLLCQKRWAEYLTVIVTASFLPLEAYELYKHRSPLKAGVIVLNLAIVIYLFIRLRRNRVKAT